MRKFIVTTSFASPLYGSHAAGEEIELDAKAASDLAPFLHPVAGSEIETADHVPAVETADVKRPRKTKG